MKEVCRRLEAWGCDISGAMERFLGNEELYEKFVCSTVEDESFALLNKAISENNMQDAFEHAHTLKGVCGNLGLTPLYDQICLLVEELRAGRYENVPHCYQEFIAVYREYCGIIKPD